MAIARKSRCVLLMAILSLVGIAILSSPATASGVWAYDDYYGFKCVLPDGFNPQVLSGGYLYYCWSYLHTEHLPWTSPFSENGVTHPRADYPQYSLGSQCPLAPDQRCRAEAHDTYQQTVETGYTLEKSSYDSEMINVTIKVENLGEVSAEGTHAQTETQSWHYSASGAYSLHWVMRAGHKGTLCVTRTGMLDVWSGQISGCVYSAQDGHTPPQQPPIATGTSADSYSLAVATWCPSPSDPCDIISEVIGCITQRGGCGATDNACNGMSCWKHSGCAHNGPFAGDPAFIQHDARVKVRN